MDTWAAGTRKARTLYAKLSPERQQALIEQCSQGKVMQFDTRGQEQEKVVGVFFGMDVCADSRYVYLFADDVQDTTKKENHHDRTISPS